MEKQITITLSVQQVRDITAAITIWLNRKNAPANWRHRAERLTEIKKKYSEQKNLDAVCLAANGGKLELLSGESGRLREVVRSMTEHHEFIKERISRMTELRDELRSLIDTTDMSQISE